MIDPRVFKASRELARSKLEPEEAKNSFGYWIDIPNHWENYSHPQDLVGFLSIHRTHELKLNEILEDLGLLSVEQKNFVFQYVKTYEHISRLICTGIDYKDKDLRHDVAESLLSWKVISRFTSFPCNILDFGAGAARYGVMSSIQNRENCYTAVDSTLAAYTIQNLVLSYLDLGEETSSFCEYLDYESRDVKFPLYEKNSKGSFLKKRLHMPLWIAEHKLQSKQHDVIIASFVHGELSEPDFFRLVKIIECSLADEGIVYVRSELTWGNTKNFYDAVDLHGVELLKCLKERDIYPVWCQYIGGFLTSVFARKSSKHYKLTQNSRNEAHQFVHIDNSRDISLLAAEHYIKKSLLDVIEEKSKTIVFGESHELFNKFIKPLEGKFNKLTKYESFEFLSSKDQDLINKIKQDAPDTLIVISDRLLSFQYCLEFEKNLQEYLSYEFTQRRAYLFYSIMILHRKPRIKQDPLLTQPIYTLTDVIDHNGDTK